MNVLVDTSVWSLALRRRRGRANPSTEELSELVQEGRVAMIGPIRQELLSGIKEESQFRTLRDHLRSFPDLLLDNTDYEEAARCFNECRGRGVPGSNTDFLICAVALTRAMSIYTTDEDFDHYSKILSVKLHEAR